MFDCGIAAIAAAGRNDLLLSLSLRVSDASRVDAVFVSALRAAGAANSRHGIKIVQQIGNHVL